MVTRLLRRTEMMKRRSQRKVCQIVKLSDRIKKYVFDFLVDEKSIRKTYKSDLGNIVLLFPECKKYYLNTIDQFRLPYYLKMYSRKYCDVFKLACKLGVLGSKDFDTFPVKKLEYSVVNVNDPRFWKRDHGIIYHDENGSLKINRYHSQVTFINKCDHQLYLTYNEFIELTDLSLLFDRSIAGLTIWDRVLICRDSFPFLHEENVRIQCCGRYLKIDSDLPIDKFKELVNLKEGRLIFTIEPNGKN